MRPAASVLLLTTLIGAGQGLFIALFGVELVASLRGTAGPDLQPYLVAGSAIALILSGIGLIASFFHLGHPMRAWRAVWAWRTSWLSREVIVLPAFMALVFVYGVAHWAQAGGTLTLGALGTVLSIALYVCTGMIYAAIRAIREWASALTVVNYLLLGLASGFTLAAALAALIAPELAGPLALLAAELTVLGALTRIAALMRNARMVPITTPQTAIGVRHPRVVQRAQGAMGGSFNTREFFHGRGERFFAVMRTAFLVLAFGVPLVLLLIGAGGDSVVSLAAIVLAFPIQYVGLLAERWHFFAQANHTQNLYYRSVA